jgi:hypothetical protein
LEAVSIDVAAIEREGLARFSQLAARIAPRGRRTIVPALAALNPAGRRSAPATLLVNRFTGKWRDPATGAAGLGAVDLVAYLANVSRDDAAIAVRGLLDENGGAA